MGSLLSLFKRQPQTCESEPPTSRQMLPAPGSVAPCLFSHNREVVYAMCAIEEQNGSRLLLRVVREVGKVTLAGLKVGVGGQVEAANHRIPLSVVQVQLPWIVVSTFPEQSRPIQRQFLRVPASFTVRFRQRSPEGLWRVGKGINLSNGGFLFACPGRELPRVGAEYFAEIAIPLAPSRQAILEMLTEVRWVSRRVGELAVGVRVTEATHRKDLANIVSQLQHLMAHLPEEYLLIEPQRPRLR